MSFILSGVSIILCNLIKGWILVEKDGQRNKAKDCSYNVGMVGRQYGPACLGILTDVTQYRVDDSGCYGLAWYAQSSTSTPTPTLVNMLDFSSALLLSTYFLA
jgi:hypothetical protein